MPLVAREKGGTVSKNDVVEVQGNANEASVPVTMRVIRSGPATAKRMRNCWK